MPAVVPSVDVRKTTQRRDIAAGVLNSHLCDISRFTPVELADPPLPNAGRTQEGSSQKTSQTHSSHEADARGE